MTYLVLLILGLVLGGGIIFLLMNKTKPTTTSLVSQQTVIEKIEQVFKVVVAEGFFSEIYDYQHTSKWLYVIPSTKKALLIVNAKVMMGYDFKKLKLEINENTNEIKILEFPEPEILSVDPDVRYYNVEENLINKFSTEDLTQMQADAKKSIIEKAKQSDLPKIARQQMQNLLLELSELKNWKLKGINKMLANYEPEMIELKAITNKADA